MDFSFPQKPDQSEIIQKYDLELLKRWYAGDDNAFTELWERYYDSVLIFILDLSKDKSLAKDITQETFLNIWDRKNKKEGDPIKNFKAFVFRAAINNFRSNRRVHNGREAIIKNLETVDSSNHDYDNFENKEYLDYLLSKILTEDQKQVHELKKQGYNNEEIGEKIQKSTDQVRGLYHRGTKKLNEYQKRILKFLHGNHAIIIIMLYIF